MDTFELSEEEYPELARIFTETSRSGRRNAPSTLRGASTRITDRAEINQTDNTITPTFLRHGDNAGVLQEKIHKPEMRDFSGIRESDALDPLKEGATFILRLTRRISKALEYRKRGDFSIMTIPTDVPTMTGINVEKAEAEILSAVRKTMGTIGTTNTIKSLKLAATKTPAVSIELNL